MTEYVSGFLFNHQGTEVALVVKATPDALKGFVTGVGGKPFPGEVPPQTMEREGWEEFKIMANLRTSWKLFCVLSGDRNHDGQPFKIHFFHSRLQTSLRLQDVLPTAYRTEMGVRERILITKVTELGKHNCIPNVHWLIQMALRIHKDRTEVFHVTEEY